MFGSKKRKEQNKLDELTMSVALEAFQTIFQAQRESLETFDKYLQKEESVKHPHGGTAIFFAEGNYDTLDFMFYHVGFIFGLCQSRGQDGDEFRVNVIFKFADLWSNMVNRTLERLGLPKEQHPYVDIFKKRYELDLFRQNNEKMDDFLHGLAEGKEFGDFNKGIVEDYSLLHSAEFTSKGNLKIFNKMLNEWQAAVLYTDNENMRRLKSE